MQSRPKSRQRIRARGQHMLVSKEIAYELVVAAGISREDVVLEIGTGKGIITSRLSEKAKKVISYEIDRQLFQAASRALSNFKNLDMRLGDAFGSDSDVRFDVCVTSLPYSESLRFIRWLSLRSNSFKRCVAIIQSEFAEKISSIPALDSYRAVSVIAQNSFEIERLFQIKRKEFDPQPRVLSEAVRLTPRRDIPQPFFDRARIAMVNQLFSFRGRLLSAAVAKINSNARNEISGELLNTRIESLSPGEFANLIPKLESVTC